uniref:Uncharacterized protein n=1 Tax=Romanomermis culicivorax TaxID=13658 RepID=A0A915K189_ROMCU
MHSNVMVERLMPLKIFALILLFVCFSSLAIKATRKPIMRNMRGVCHPCQQISINLTGFLNRITNEGSFLFMLKGFLAGARAVPPLAYVGVCVTMPARAHRKRPGSETVDWRKHQSYG